MSSKALAFVEGTDEGLVPSLFYLHAVRSPPGNLTNFRADRHFAFVPCSLAGLKSVAHLGKVAKAASKSRSLRAFSVPYTRTNSR
jgi:hypothetical protein